MMYSKNNSYIAINNSGFNTKHAMKEILLILLSILKTQIETAFATIFTRFLNKMHQNLKADGTCNDILVI